MHLAVLTSAHPLDDVRVYSKVVASALSAGHDVTWVGPDHSFYTPSFRDPRVRYLLTGYSPGTAGRISTLRRLRSHARTIHGVDWWYSPDPDTAALLPAIARRRGGSTVFDIHEAFHEGLLDRYTYGLRVAPLRRLVQRRISAICTRIDLVVGVSRSVLSCYLDGTTDGLVIPSYASASFADQRAPAWTRQGEGLVLSHGKLSPVNGTSRVLDALRVLAARHTPPSVQVVVYDPPLGGDRSFETVAIERIRTEGLGQLVLRRKGVAHALMPGELQACDVGMIAYGRKLGVDSLPNRLFEYMASGLAILAPSYSPEIRAIVEPQRLGLLVDFESPDEIASAIEWCVANPEETAEMGRRGRAAFLERHTWEAASQRLFERLHH